MKVFKSKGDFKGGKLEGSLRPEQVRLSVPAASSCVATKWKWHHQRLTRLLEKLRGAQQAHLEDAAATKPAFSMSMADGATDQFDRDLLLSVAVSEQEAIYEIEEALKRIENGNYGICELTGKPISKARLRTIPWTRFSQRAELDLERRGTVHPARLGQLGSVRASGEIQLRGRDRKGQAFKKKGES